MLLTPVATYIFMLIFFVYWVAVYLHLSTAEEPYLNSAYRVRYRDDGNYKKMWWYHLFGLFWTSQFILACEDLVIAGAIAAWYFTREKAKVKHAWRKSVWRLLRYHLGTVALGSLIIAVIQV